MAAVVSHAMRRFPTSSSDTSSYGLRGESSRKSWSKGEEGESALSRSMRYADPWLYGSVRAPGGLLLTPAFVLCTCSDYLNGTKRSSKKGPTTCKKCKGARLPLSPGEATKFGTVRCYSTTHAPATTPLRAGTVRVSSSARPSILPSPDPYDLMRRSRLSVSESSSQFRTRSVSPSKSPSKLKSSEPRSHSKSRSKGNKEQSYNSTLGRRSILECNINPYELMSAESEARDSSITFVNGQRIRVRPTVTEQVYEDVQVRRPTNQTPKQNIPNKITSSSSPKLNEKESECNRFKSILKKPTTTFSDTDSIAPERSPSPAHKSGSHFYIPMPGHTPRKKVQFLVENELVCQQSNNRKDETKYNDEEEEPQGPEQSPHHTNNGFSEKQKTVCKLRRSESERLTQEQVKVKFIDTMALRQKPARGDSRLTFDTKDLERLDGITPRTRKISPTKERPILPPPLPPAQIDPDDASKVCDETILNKKPIEELKVCAEDKKITKVNKTVKTENIPPKCNNEESKSKANGSLNKCQLDENGVLRCKIFSENINNTSSNKMSLFKSKHYEDIVTPFKKEDIVSDSNKLVQNEPLSEAARVTTNLIDNQIKQDDNPPSAPPRKRSNGKQPQINIVHSPCVQTVKIESPVSDYPKKTVVQINGSPAVHKLQIKNEFSDAVNVQTVSVSETPQRKTSIMINGDDCYCTVNVNDNIPLYQSSVVVKDVEVPQTPTSPKMSSSVYITGTFISNENEINLAMNNSHPKEEESSFVESKDIEKHTESNTISFNKDHVTKDIKNVVNIETEKNRHNTSLLEAFNESDIPSSELLKELLQDPVEAVRRNLVPHVCGKSDMPRRPRDTKVIKNDLPVYFLEDPPIESALQVTTDLSSSLEDSFLRLRNYESLGDDACSEHSSSTQYELMDPGSDCYTDHSNRSSVTEEELANRNKFYELLADSSLIEVSESEDHHYESIKANPDPIYEEIEIPPPLPANPPPLSLLDDLQLDKEFTTRSIFEGASKYDILSYLVDAKERGIVQEDGYSYNFGTNGISPDEDPKEPFNRVSHMSTVSDSSEDNSLIISGALIDDKVQFPKPAEVERNDSGVGSETSKSSLSKYRTKQETLISCEDCEAVIDYQTENEPLICRKCIKRRCERKEIITEIVETEEKYSRDLQIILEEFYQPMLVAGLLTPEQLSAIFLNVEELLENSQALAERLRDAVEIATEQGDEDLLTVNMGKLFLEAAPMLHAFETYCIRQGPASLLLASLEKDKELLRIFLRVSQMENTMLRRMNLNSFLMVPVQRVTKYPLLLARLFKVTPNHHETREQLREAQHKIELHLNHMNSETKDIPSKLWRRIGSSSGRRSSAEMDLVNIKLRKIAVDVLEWNHEEAKFVLEGKLLFTQPTDNNWRKGRTIKLTPVNALLVINGKALASKGDRTEDNDLIFTRHSSFRDAALLLVRDKNGRYSLLREPLYLDRCVVAADPAWQSYFEVQEILGKDTFIFKAEDESQTTSWYRQLQVHAQGMGAWRKRRNALANIMINGMGLRS